MSNKTRQQAIRMSNAKRKDIKMWEPDARLGPDKVDGRTFYFEHNGKRVRVCNLHAQEVKDR